MSARLVEWVSELVTRHRRPVMASLVLAAIALGSQLPSIESNPSPQALVASVEGQAEITQAFEQAFGAHEELLLVLVQADDVLQEPTLQYVHTLSGRFRELEAIRRVMSPTVTPLPHRAGGPEEPDGSMALNAQQPRDLLSQIKARDPENRDDFELLDLISPIMEGDLEHFPQGTLSLTRRIEQQGITGEPVVTGQDVTTQDSDALRGLVERSPLVRGRLVSPDRTVAAIALALAPSMTAQARQSLAVDQVRETLASMKAPSGVDTRLGGVPFMHDALLEKIRADQLTLNPAIGLVCVLVLVATFRWLPAVVGPLLAVALTAVMVVGGMALFGQELTIITNIIPPLLIIIGLSDSIHLVGRYRDELQAQGDRMAAGRASVRAIAVACFLTSVTTAVGFASLSIARTPELRSFGLVAAVGVLVAYVVTLGFLPGALTMAKIPEHLRGDASGRLERSVVALTRRVLRHPWWVLAGAATLAVGMGLTASKLRPDAALLDAFDREDASYTTTRLLERKLQGIRPLEVMIHTDRAEALLDQELVAELQGIEAWARRQPSVLDSFSYVDILQEVSALLTGDASMREARFRTQAQAKALADVARMGTEGGLSRYLTEDARRGRLTVHLEDVGVQRSLTLIDGLQQRLDDALGKRGIEYSLTGEAYIGSVGRISVLRDLLWGLMLAVALIFVILTALFRSVRLGLISIPPNILPLLMAAGYMSLRDIPLNLATAITFSIGIGLAVDGTIHVLARFKEEASDGLDTEEALLRAARGTGKAIVVTTLTLALGFSVVLLSSFVSVRQFGELITVLVTSCLLATLVVQPALLKIAGGPATK